MQALEVILLPEPLRLEAITETGETVVVHARLVGHGASCPDCGESATHVQGKYVRRVDDVPWADRRIRLHVTIRRFWCATADCPRRIFAERLGDFAPPYARRTARADTALEAVAFALGGEAGSRLARRLSLPTSPDTLLRLIRRFGSAAWMTSPGASGGATARRWSIWSGTGSSTCCPSGPRRA